MTVIQYRRPHWPTGQTAILELPENSALQFDLQGWGAERIDDHDVAYTRYIASHINERLEVA